MVAISLKGKKKTVEESGMLLIFTENFQVYHDPETPSRVAAAEVDGTDPLCDGADGVRAI